MLHAYTSCGTPCCLTYQPCPGLHPVGEGVKYLLPVTVYAAAVPLLYSLYTAEAPWASVGAILAIELLANDYVKHL